MRALPLSLCLLALGCLGDGGPDSDAVDASGDAADDADTDARGDVTCDTARMENVVAKREILEGDFCDVIELCAADLAAADAITAIEPGFTCGEPGGCAEGEVGCSWSTPDVLDALEYERLCAISSIEDAPLMRCYVFL